MSYDISPSLTTSLSMKLTAHIFIGHLYVYNFVCSNPVNLYYFNFIIIPAKEPRSEEEKMFLLLHCDGVQEMLLQNIAP